jgi:hypothetical protein
MVQKKSTNKLDYTKHKKYATMVAYFFIGSMHKKDDLIRENEALRARLEAAERWMRREVEDAKR